jgi:predicted RNA binding protein YcfA (HicA-like mRNA interferase family)
MRYTSLRSFNSVIDDMKKRKILAKVLSGSKNIRFDEFVALLEGFGFIFQRITGSHHIFSHPKIMRPFPIQNVKGKAKPYQVDQLLKFVEEYDLQLVEE